MSADTIVPGYANPQNLNRYSYVTNNPLRYTDPTGHWRAGAEDTGCSLCTPVPSPSDGNSGGDSGGETSEGSNSGDNDVETTGANGSEPCTVNGVNTTCDVDLEANATASNLDHIAMGYNNLKTEIILVAILTTLTIPPLSLFFYWEADAMGDLSDFYGNAAQAAQNSSSGTATVKRFTSVQTYGVSSLSYSTPSSEGHVFVPVTRFSFIAVKTLRVR